jgi:protein-disulfide isomerase
MQSEGHKNSCLKTRYALAAAKQNMYWQMADILFEQAPENEKEIIEEARLANFDIKKLQDDANSEEIKQELANSIKEADEKSINGTPTLFIGMKRILGVNSYPELRNMVIEQGGKEKQ